MAVRYQYIFDINAKFSFKIFNIQGLETSSYKTSSYSNFRYIGTRWIIFLSNFGDQSLIITDDPSVGIKNIFVLAPLDSAKQLIGGSLEEDFVRLEQRFLPLGAQLVGTFERVDLEVEGTPGTWLVEGTPGYRWRGHLAGEGGCKEGWRDGE